MYAEYSVGENSISALIIQVNNHDVPWKMKTWHIVLIFCLYAQETRTCHGVQQYSAVSSSIIIVRMNARMLVQSASMLRS